MASLDRLLRPRSVAVIGGGVWAANVIRECRRIGFAGAIWPVHPTKAEVGGLPAVPRVEDLPAAPDAAYIAVNRRITVDAVAALAAKGAGGAVCFASGFREAAAELEDGPALQDRLVAAAGEMRFLGPNCYGFINALDGAALWPDQHGLARGDRGVAIITQSSNIALNLTMHRRGLPIAYLATLGNQAQTGLADLGAALLEDDRVTALGLHIEGVGDLARMAALAATAHRLGKSVVVLKVGASEAARAATLSHTASLAGSDAGARALFARLGFGQVRTLPELLEALKLLHVTGPLDSNRIASVSCSGGEASLMADSALATDLNFPDLGAAAQARLRAVLGPQVALANPLDYHTYIWGDGDRIGEVFAAVAGADVAMTCGVLDFPRADRCDPAEWGTVLDAVIRVRAETGRPLALLATLPETMPEDVACRAMAAGVVPFAGMAEAMTAMDLAARIGREAPGPVLSPRDVPAPRVLTEAEAKALLAGAGIAVPASERARTPDQAAEAAARIGYPVVLKGEGIAHKTEAGAVRLNLRSADQVREAAEAIPADSFLVERMIDGDRVELLLGVVADPAHGYVLTLGAGGQWAELLADTQSLLLPVTREAVLAALARLRIGPMLTGYRGLPGADLDAIWQTVEAVQRMVADGPPVAEIEINPLFALPRGAVAVDALMKLGGDDD